MSLHEGQLVRVTGTQEIYVVQAGQVCYVPSPTILAMHGWNPDSVTNIERGEFDSLPRGADIAAFHRLYKDSGGWVRVNMVGDHMMKASAALALETGKVVGNVHIKTNSPIGFHGAVVVVLLGADGHSVNSATHFYRLGTTGIMGAERYENFSMDIPLDEVARAFDLALVLVEAPDDFPKVLRNVGILIDTVAQWAGKITAIAGAGKTFTGASKS